MTGQRVYYYTPQRDAVTSLLGLIGSFPLPGNLHSITHREQIAGMRPGDGAFAHVTNHPDKVPAEILEAARYAGLIDIAMSDEWRRLFLRNSNPARWGEPAEDVSGRKS